MAWYYLINTVTGALLSESSEPIETPPDGCSVVFFDTRQGQNGERWNPSTLTFGSAPIAIRPLTHYEFRCRFTIAERVLLDNYTADATLSDTQKAVLCTIFKDFEAAQFIDLNLPAVGEALATIESYGLLVAGRGQEILNG